MTYDDEIQQRKDEDDAERDVEIAQQVEAELQIDREKRVRNTYFAIIDAEGWHHVEGLYYADLEDSDRQRWLFAARIVDHNIRIDAWKAKQGAAA